MSTSDVLKMMLNRVVSIRCAVVIFQAQIHFIKLDATLASKKAI